MFPKRPFRWSPRRSTSRAPKCMASSPSIMTSAARRPGAHVLKLCRAEACQATGGDALAARAERRLGVALGETTRRRPRHARAGLLPRPVRHRAVGDARRPRRRPARRSAARRAAGGGASDDAASTSRAMPPRSRSAPTRSRAALRGGGRKRGIALEIVRTGSRGLYWLEPMIEVETPQRARRLWPGRRRAMLPALLDALLAGGKPHPLRLGLTDDIPCLKRQTRLTFARCGVIDPLSLDDYRAHGGCRASRAR